ncbi:MAG: S-adenosylhomocysteine hydrolase [Aquabacterium sp.]|uniref:S-adenosylhomocysteine hydrolase n=1 Tax=Aquabacterium sp. TaxID=1872578 RepID=UPI003BB007F3
MARTNSLQDQIEARIAKRDDAVFLTREFNDLGDKRQVLRALAKTVADGNLIRLGYGVYGRAIRSRLDGRPMLYSQDGFIGAAREALTKLGVAWEPTEWEKAYNEGRSTQVPVNPQLKVKGRFSRKLRDGATELVLDR